MDKLQGIPMMNSAMENPLLQQVRKNSGPSFADKLQEAVQDVDELQKVADLRIERFASGEEVDVHGMMIALQEADISLKVLGSFRNKFVEAYKGLVNMSI